MASRSQYLWFDRSLKPSVEPKKKSFLFVLWYQSLTLGYTEQNIISMLEILFILCFRRDNYLKYELANESEFHSQSSFSHHIQFQNTKIVKMLLPTTSHSTTNHPHTSWRLPLNEIIRTTHSTIQISNKRETLHHMD